MNILFAQGLINNIFYPFLQNLLHDPPPPLFDTLAQYGED